MNDFWKSYDITHAEYGADYRCYPLYGTCLLYTSDAADE